MRSRLQMTCTRCYRPIRREDCCWRRCMARFALDVRLQMNCRSCHRCMARFGPLMTLFSFFYPIVEFFLPISVSFLVIWVLLRPNRVLPHVAAAVLTQLDATSVISNTTGATAETLLSYDLSVDLSFRNPSGRLSVRYLDLVAVASYGGERLGASSDVLPVFIQHPREIRAVQAIFQGTDVRVGPAAAEVFREEVADGTFNVLVTVKSSFMCKVLFQKAVYYYNYECYLPFPVPHGGVPQQAVSRITCARSSND